jgi:hypothetical protein
MCIYYHNCTVTLKKTVKVTTEAILGYQLCHLVVDEQVLLTLKCTSWIIYYSLIIASNNFIQNISWPVKSVYQSCQLSC